jgi:phytoene synthase
MVESKIYQIFKRGSRTYFYNSLFFPKEIRDDVFHLYSFVREADNFVDAIPQKKDEFCDFYESFCNAWDGEKTNDVVLDGFIELAHRKKFEKEWVEAFLHSMELDLTRSTYDTLEEVEEYIYGSAEVVGLMMSAIMGVKKEFYPNARSLGKAMQYINFIRDIDEDIGLGRRYIPTEELEKYDVKDLSRSTTRECPDCFKALIDAQVEKYLKWQADAEKGFKGLEKRFRVPVANASDMYKWTAMKIVNDPFIVYRKKVKPSKSRIILNLYHKKLFMK